MFTASLEIWRSVGSDEENRSEAVKKILEAYECGATELSLEDLGLKSLPRAIGYLDKLERLDLRNNEINELPSTMKSLKQLKTLHTGETKAHLMLQLCLLRGPLIQNRAL
jgi:Leucine-rich repeat (LRR) protein